MAATAQPKKIRTLRAYCVDTILKRVATYDVSEQQRQKGDAALMEGSGDGQLHRVTLLKACLLYTSPSPRDGLLSRMPSSA